MSAVVDKVRDWETASVRCLGMIGKGRVSFVGQLSAWTLAYAPQVGLFPRHAVHFPYPAFKLKLLFSGRKYSGLYSLLRLPQHVKSRALPAQQTPLCPSERSRALVRWDVYISNAHPRDISSILRPTCSLVVTTPACIRYLAFLNTRPKSDCASASDAPPPLRAVQNARTHLNG